MNFFEINENDAAVRALRSMVDRGEVPHALLLVEDPAGGGFALAMAFLRYLYCHSPNDGEACGQCPPCVQMGKLMHPDVHFIFPVNKGSVIKGDHPVSEQGLGAFRELALSNPYFTEQELYAALGMEDKFGNISAAEARFILDKMSFSSLSGGYKSVVLFLPERMDSAAANRLLKIMEEPPELTVFILITQHFEDVMATISSRCRTLRVMPPRGRRQYRQTFGDEFTQVWTAMVKAVVERNLPDALGEMDKISQTKNREKQKAFCIFASEQIRGALMFSRGLDDLARLDSPLAGVAREVASVSEPLALMRIAAAIDKAGVMLGCNVSPKIVFTDLLNRIFVNLYDGKRK